MNVIKATVILNSHTADCVVLHIGDKPSPMPNVTLEHLDVMFYAGFDTGEQYVKTNFPDIPIIVIPRK
jgi:hypothetical protein